MLKTSLPPLSVQSARFPESVLIGADGISKLCAAAKHVRATGTSLQFILSPCTFDSQVDYTLCSNRMGRKEKRPNTKWN